jgi:Ala-tRNA(Pro) deacylase
MTMTETELYEFLQEHYIEFQRYEHPAVYTVEQANRHLLDAPGARTKNLFICDEKKQDYFILWLPSDKQVHFNRLGKEQSLGKPRFGSPEKLKEYLDLEPGSVSVLALVNDPQQRVSLLIDRELWQEDSFQCHPLVNTASLVISRPDIERFFALTGHTLRLIDVPSK